MFRTLTIIAAIFLANPLSPLSADFYGAAVVSLGDINEDGGFEYAVADPFFGSDDERWGTGRVQVVSAPTNKVIRVFDGKSKTDRFGATMISPGDLDGDGEPDLIIGAQGSMAKWTSSEVDVAGYVVAVSLASGQELYRIDTPAGKYQTMWHGAHALPTLVALDDLNGDGISDFAIGSPFVRSEGDDHAGAVRIYSGRDGEVLREKFGSRPHSHLGTRLAVIDDLDGDDLNDVLIGGGAVGCETVPERHAWGFVLACSSGELSELFRIEAPQESSSFGRSLCGLGDTNNDGIPDFAVGDHRSAVFRYSGRDGALLGEWESRLPRISLELIRLDDVNGDQTDDLGISVKHSLDPKYDNSRALLYVVSGSSNELLAEVEWEVWNFLRPGVALSILPRANTDNPGFVLVGTASIRNPSSEGSVHIVDLQTLKIKSRTNQSDLLK